MGRAPEFQMPTGVRPKPLYEADGARATASRAKGEKEAYEWVRLAGRKILIAREIAAKNGFLR
jgi:hypothetical protein